MTQLRVEHKSAWETIKCTFEYVPHVWEKRERDDNFLESFYVRIFKIIHCRVKHVWEISIFIDLHECVGDGDATQRSRSIIWQSLLIVVALQPIAVLNRRSSVSVAVLVVALDTVAIVSESLFFGRCFLSRGLTRTPGVGVGVGRSRQIWPE